MTTVSFFNNFIEDVGRKRIDLLNDVFKIILVNAYTFNAAHNKYADVSNKELPTSHGYTVGGIAIANKTWAWDNTNQFTKLDGDDISWHASGGDIGPFTGAIIVDTTVTSPTATRLMQYIDFGGAQTILNNSDFKLVVNANGVFNVEKL